MRSENARAKEAEADRVVAGMNVNVWDVNEAIRELIWSRHTVDTSRLEDPDVPVDALVAVATGSRHEA